MTEEIWRPVVGFPGYEVSSLGRVVSYKRRRPRELARVPNGRYLKVALTRDGEMFSRSVHVVVAEAFHGPRPEGQQVRHLDGDGHRNDADNLAWGSPVENAADKARHGTEHNARKTHCAHGHEFSEENVYLARGRRYCRTCKFAWLRLYKQRQVQAA